MNDRMFLPLVIRLRDRETFEKIFPAVEDLLQRRDHQRLPEPPRTSEKIALSARRDKPVEVRSLIDIQHRRHRRADVYKTPVVFRYRL